MFKKLVTIIFIITIALAVSTAHAQEYTHSFSNNSENILNFAISQGNLTIESYSGDEIIIQNKNYTDPPERAEGLRSLFSGGPDNTGIGLTVEESGNHLRIMSVQPRSGDFILKVPDNIRLVVNQVNWGIGNIELTGHRGEIEISGKNGNISLRNITGPVNANTTSGNIEIIFSEISQERPTSISNVSGFIDITLPETTTANVNLSSISGGIYTDIDIEIAGSRTDLSRLGGGNRISGSINGGGIEIGLRAISGDIFLRRK
jgi:hypothetical protein